MFDTFDLLVPRLLSLPGLEIRQRETAFGLADERHVYVGDANLGRAMVANEAFSAVEAWTGAPDRSDWTVILLSHEANTAAQHDALWSTYLDALLTILRAHPSWRVTCESDCDQHPLVRLYLTPDALVRTLDRHRTDRHYPIAFLGTSLDGDQLVHRGRKV